MEGRGGSVAQLLADVAEHAVVSAARVRSVGVRGISACYADPSAAPGLARLVLGFGGVTGRAVAEGIATVGDLLDPRG